MNGLIGKKIGMSRIFSEQGEIIPVSIIKIENNQVVNIKNKERDGYQAVVLGIDDIKKTKVKKCYAGIFKENVNPKKVLKEFRVDDISDYKIGQEIGLEIFNNVKYVDISGKTKGKGFQGVVKRHNFHGGPASHGSKFHRENGSTGQNTFPSRVFKGVKRAGRMGNENVTIQNLKVVKIDLDKKLLLVKGAVPGYYKSILYIKKSIKKK